MADAALLRVFSVVRPFAGGGSSTPARRALLRPMAIACFVDRAPCLPSRMWCISSRTNSPACVEVALPWRLSRCARSRVTFSAIFTSVQLVAFACEPCGADELLALADADPLAFARRPQAAAH